MSARLVHTQAELDAALADPTVALIDIHAEAGVSEITTSGSETVHAYGSATVHAYGSATVHASGSVTVHASDSATVHASGSATVHAYDSATVHASTGVAVHLHTSRARVDGGVLIDHTAIDDSDPRTWAEYHGATLVEGDEDTGTSVTVYKAVRDDLRSTHGALYMVGAEVTCDDFEDTDACGNGLHFSPSPHQADSYDPDATRYLECVVALADLHPITDSGVAKCKAPRAFVTREVDIAGRPVTPAGGDAS